MNTVQAYVTKADGDFIIVKTVDAKIKEKLIDIGFTNDIDLNEYKIITLTNEKKAEAFNQLRNIEVYFSDGREWCPAEIFEYLRDKKLLIGKFTMISWAAPGKYFITTDK
ncbi:MULTISPECIES: hypothetical protein [Pseudomonas]|uniref:Uncharacterized protein n=1 Tax=Pseudomonas chlororaphis subsp. aureofaciens TaxID=587851 RepID=A0AAD0ZDQ6_9PSED|nr:MULTISPECIES: hypothetical protein [Pseudomonas]AZD83092.1 hypothetical protein C4K14_0237 [Pseudomonas chlororaphis subsp. aureofaciens]AZD89683.1 hypothetical protein C4K13_0235 [Pseudomonas chlororaphis subsp. aureofaciens]AZD96134.1 hypothetical protein C4K12_0237 [Pseudomonas chlororaphis subsp. aureofaciens]AZE08545.1 hypothetical protein C4K10_0234 [Pseudomonas chlororaphis subsp. aureofaciens]AZE27043.1 hypothetical protein C4K07_0227 [Pseudomonas chlororaphis subsp. aureofaciens]